VGVKTLFIMRMGGEHCEISPLCLLDFYIHKGKQRQGLGKQFFDAVLQLEQTEALALAYDKPSKKSLAFLKRHAARNNFQVAVDEGKLIFKKAAFSSSPTKIEMGKSLRSLRMGFNSMEQVEKVVVRGWDIREKKEIVGQASTGDIESIGGGQVGASVSSGKFGGHTAYITDVPVGSQAQANAVAKAEMNRLARQFAKGSCTVDGNDGLRAGTVVEFAGLNTNHNGKFYVISSRHIISPSTGYLTEVTFCSNTFGS
jgi:phage protein D